MLTKRTIELSHLALVIYRDRDNWSIHTIEDAEHAIEKMREMNEAIQELEEALKEMVKEMETKMDRKTAFKYIAGIVHHLLDRSGFHGNSLDTEYKEALSIVEKFPNELDALTAERDKLRAECDSLRKQSEEIRELNIRDTNVVLHKIAEVQKQRDALTAKLEKAKETLKRYARTDKDFNPPEWARDTLAELEATNG